MEILNYISQIIMVLSTILVTMIAIDKVTDIYKWLGNKYVIVWGSVFFVISTFSFVVTDDVLKNRAQKAVIDNLTGGNSFPISFFSPMNDTIWDVETYDSGQCALYDLTSSLIDIDYYNKYFPQSMVYALQGGTNPVNLGASSHTHNLYRNNFKRKDIDRNFILEYSARNLSFKQYIKCRYKSGKWLYATKIVRISSPKEILFEKAQDGFLNDNENPINWIDYCNEGQFKTIKNQPY